MILFIWPRNLFFVFLYIFHHGLEWFLFIRDLIFISEKFYRLIVKIIFLDDLWTLHIYVFEELIFTMDVG